ncbi:uncharacterized protein CPUR_00143 [Claviceps purpurea 20.1]|uniref:Inositol polyphosphate-related phosphatase domain-containing protein n=1 Tax=Claviceps purpurea (strain 20.1) TaxID=1111077 RepID=M1W8Q4_CLAP2|nr:uncharacterized protein CPUR_00143 [Claviceps purpurea 20.1]
MAASTSTKLHRAGGIASTASAAATAMQPPTVDLLVLTFNCAKALIHAGVFANHAHTAFANHATGLPDVVVLSLQEVAPLSQSFIGEYFLNPYYSRFDEAVNLAAQRFQHGPRKGAGGAAKAASEPIGSGISGLDADSEGRRRQQDEPEKVYTLIKAHNVGYTAILLFAKDPQHIRNLQHAAVGFGTAEMGSKGAVGLRALYDITGDGTQSTELTFVAAHLAAMEYNLPQRNANWAAIMSGLTFENPVVTHDERRTPETPTSADLDDDMDENDGESQEQRGLLHDTHRREQPQVQQRLHDISVFKPSSHLFVAGDLNYRISTSSPPPNATFPSEDPSSENYYPTFLPQDQLTHERRAGRTMHGLSEASVQFPPTYKYDVLPKENPDADDEHEDQVPWEFASHRWPSWTDRVLYLEVPPWVHGNSPRDSDPSPPRIDIDVLAYDALPLMRSSDHRAVYFRALVPLIPPEDMRPPAEGDYGTDPRVKLPVEIDREAWSRRRVARRKELVTGWCALLWSTKEGAWMMAVLVAAGVGTWWFYNAG